MEMYVRLHPKKKAFTLLHCYTKLKGNAKWRQLRNILAKGPVVDLDEPIRTSEGRPIGNKKAKADAAASDKLSSSIDKYIVDVSASMQARAEKSDERWNKIFLNQDVKIDIEKEKIAVEKKKVAVEKRKEAVEKERVATKRRAENLKILNTDTSNMDPATLDAHNFYRDQVLQEIADARAAMALAAAKAQRSAREKAAAVVAAEAAAADAAAAEAAASASASASPFASVVDEEDDVVEVAPPSTSPDDADDCVIAATIL
jgi:hypothetical protein